MSRNSTKAFRIVAALLIAAATAAGCAVYYTFDPGTAPFAPRCLFKAVTGLQCPGCGSQRMLHALLHGDLRAAWGYNAFLLLMLPVLALLLFAACTRRRFPLLYARLNSPRMITALATLVIGWGFFRNLI